ncbi:MAG TPA: hypothetical protein VNK96_03725 [Fimbriimonadales bacterium]|nr:hypothetical protein [Fimbriimonadales bacterium]
MGRKSLPRRTRLQRQVELDALVPLQQRFSWQGISFPVNEDWRPVVFSGTEREGYVRLEGENEGKIQLRWNLSRVCPNLERNLAKYFDALKRGAKKRGFVFQGGHENSSPHALLFEWHAGNKGYGCIAYQSATKHVILLERSGRREDSFKREARILWENLQTYPVETQADVLRPWEVYGLSVRLPVKYKLDSFRFLSGRTTLFFRSKGARLKAERWGFAKQLIEKHGFVEWACAATGLQNVLSLQTENDEEKLVLSGRPVLWKRFLFREAKALISYHRNRNQIALIQSEYSKGNEPRWEWLG